MAELNDIDGLGPARSESLEDAGYESLEDLAEADSQSVADEANVPEDTALSFIVQAQNRVEGDVEDAEVDADNADAQDAPDPGDLAEPDENDSEAAQNGDEDETYDEDRDVADANADTSEERGPEAESSESEEEVESSDDEDETYDEDRDVADADARTSEERGPEAEEDEDGGDEDEDDGPYTEDRDVADADARTSENRGPDADEEDENVDTASEDEEEETYSLTVDLEEDIHNDAYIAALLNHYQRQHHAHAPSREAVEGALDDARYNDGSVSHELTEYELNELHAAISQQVNEFKGSNMLDHMNAAQDVQDQINEVREEELF